ncbi:hypothetical protein CDIK_2159 [Cucumispora dikerogammari]|nr:hypothetical protein CDIK_2159 [Cucumispora dikerogammari]
MYLYLLKLILTFDTYKHYTIIPEKSELLQILNLINENEILNDTHFFQLLTNLFISKLTDLTSSSLERLSASELLEITKKVQNTINISREHLLKIRSQVTDKATIKVNYDDETNRNVTSDWCWDSLVIKEFDKTFKKRFYD